MIHPEMEKAALRGGRKIVLTGGGTAGHVTSNIALLPGLLARGFSVYYIGSRDGIEKTLIEKEGIPYYGISTGKFRRYFDLKNFTDPLRVVKGIGEVERLLRTLKPDIVFSKGGFVAVPVAFGAKRCHIPVVSHESDMTPGLANRLSMGCALKICCNFPETLEKLPRDKAVLTGAPIRAFLLAGSAAEGRRMTGFSGEKPVLLVIGGSLGSVAINNAVRSVLPELLSEFDVVHVCGKGNVAEELSGQEGYRQYAYLTEGLEHLYAMADVAVSRAGANVISELLALRKPNILIPLPKGASRGDQILNAASFARQGFSVVLPQEEMEADGRKLCRLVREVFRDREKYAEAMRHSRQGDGAEAVLKVLDGVLGN